MIDRHWISNGLLRWSNIEPVLVGRPTSCIGDTSGDAYTDLSVSVTVLSVLVGRPTSCIGDTSGDAYTNLSVSVTVLSVLVGRPTSCIGDTSGDAYTDLSVSVTVLSVLVGRPTSCIGDTSGDAYTDLSVSVTVLSVLVGRPTSCIGDTSGDAYTDLSVSVTVLSVRKDIWKHDSLSSLAWLLASSGEGRNTRWKYILTCLLGSELSLIISWTFRILAHEEDQYSYVYKMLIHIFLHSTQTD